MYMYWVFFIICLKYGFVLLFYIVLELKIINCYMEIWKLTLQGKRNIQEGQRLSLKKY